MKLKYTATVIFVLSALLLTLCGGCAVAIEDADGPNSGSPLAAVTSAFYGKLGIEEPDKVEAHQQMRAKYGDANRMAGAGLSAKKAKLIIDFKYNDFKYQHSYCSPNQRVWVGDREIFRSKKGTGVFEVEIPAGLCEFELLYSYCDVYEKKEGRTIEKIYIKPGEILRLVAYPVAHWNEYKHPQGLAGDMHRSMSAPYLAVFESKK